MPYDRYETFEEGLLRYRLQVLCNTEAERKQVIAQFSQEQALTIPLDKKNIDEYRYNDGNLSEGDKFKRSEQMGDPIRKEFRFKDPLMPFGEPDLLNDFAYRSDNVNEMFVSEDTTTGH